MFSETLSCQPWKTTRGACKLEQARPCPSISNALRAHRRQTWGAGAAGDWGSAACALQPRARRGGPASSPSSGGDGSFRTLYVCSSFLTSWAHFRHLYIYIFECLCSQDFKMYCHIVVHSNLWLFLLISSMLVSAFLSVTCTMLLASYLIRISRESLLQSFQMPTFGFIYLFSSSFVLEWVNISFNLY